MSATILTNNDAIKIEPKGQRQQKHSKRTEARLAKESAKINQLEQKVASISKTIIKGSKNTKLSAAAARRNNFAALPRKVKNLQLLAPNVSGKSNLESMILKKILAPMDFGPLRWRSEFDGAPTALAGPWFRNDIDWGVEANTTVLLPVKENLVVLFRCAERALVQYYPNNAGANLTYAAYGSSMTGSAAVTPTTTWSMNAEGGEVNYLHIPYCKATSAAKPHGDLWLAGGLEEAPGGRFFFTPDGTNVNFTVTNNSGATSTIEVGIYIWHPEYGVNLGTRVSQSTANGAAYTTSFQVATPNGEGVYSAIYVKPSVTGSYQLSAISFAYDGATFSHLCLPDYLTNVHAAEGLRITAASLMMTNTAPDIYRNGQVVGYQSKQGEDWLSYVADFRKISKANGSIEMEVKNGMYGFLKPTQPSDFDFQTYTRTEDGVIVDCAYPLKTKSAFITIYSSIPVTTGQAGYYSACWSVEYQTSDLWRPTGVAVGAREVYSKCRDVLATTPQFYENPSHISSILGKIKSAVQGGAQAVLKYGPIAAEIASILMAI